jgi:hypothetical protein
MAKIKVPDGRGFDVVIWQKSELDSAYMAAKTYTGRRLVREWFPRAQLNKAYSLDDIFPQQLLAKAPSGLRIGGISPGARVPMLLNPSLH